MEFPRYGDHDDGDGRSGAASPKQRTSTHTAGQQTPGSRFTISGRSSAHATPHTSSSFEAPSQSSGYSSRESLDSTLSGSERLSATQFGMGAPALEVRAGPTTKGPKQSTSAAPKSPTKHVPTPSDRSKNFAMRFEDQVNTEDPTTLFDLKERLGKGSFGSVYRAVTKRTGEVVAIKIIPVADDESIEDVRREVSILQECENSHIVKYYGAYFQAENLWVRSLKAKLDLFSTFLISNLQSSN